MVEAHRDWPVGTPISSAGSRTWTPSNGARHSLRSLDALERLLLQVTRKNDTRGYERFRDLFEAIIAYNE